MRELSVYYCPKCGYYAYYQLSPNAVCPKCDVSMNLLPMRYQDFMNLSCPERDLLLSKEILKRTPTLASRLSAPHKAANYRETIANLSYRIQELEEENKTLKSTVEWMHKTIWDLIKKQKNLSQEP